MFKPFCVAVMAVLAAYGSYAQRLTPIESYIARLKSEKTFVAVDNLWQPNPNGDKTGVLQQVSKARLVKLQPEVLKRFITENHLTIELTIEGSDGNRYTLELGRYNMLASDFEAHAKGAKGSDGVCSYTPGLYYRGVVKGVEKSLAAFSFFDNEVYGVFSLPGIGNINVVPIHLENGTTTDYIVYNDQDLLDKSAGHKCHTDKLPPQEQLPHMAMKTTTTLNNNVYRMCTEVRVFEVADYALYQAKGSKVANVLNHMTALFNNQAVLYRNEEISIVLKYVEVDTVPDVYGSITVAESLVFLKTFGATTKTNMHGCDIALLLSSRFGTMGGVAWLMNLCNRYRSSDSGGPYGFCNVSGTGSVTSFPKYSQDILILVHEAGHLLGSPHTHACCWNPSGTGTTAIDGCYAIEGTCTSPGLPASGGGTIMSYCHLTSVGINFSNGFGQQPGDTVRRHVADKFAAGCGEPFLPNMALSRSNRLLKANRECFDPASGTTYYWSDNNTVDHADDTLVLMLRKNGSDIGNLNDAAFQVATGTNARYGANVGQPVTFPAGTKHIKGSNYTMNRFWNISGTKPPAAAVQVIFPFTMADSADVNGSFSTASIPMYRYQFYKTDPAIDPNPLKGFVGATTASFEIYNYAAAPNDSSWTYSRTGSTMFASILTRQPEGGGSLFLSTNYKNAVDDIAAGGAFLIYPNPATSKWRLRMDDAYGDGSIEIYAVDGKLIHRQLIEVNTDSELATPDLAPGAYYYRLITATRTFSGALSKN